MISLVKVPPDSPKFLSQTFRWAAGQRKKGSPLEEAILEEYEALSNDVDATAFQESCSVRNVLTTRAIANILIDDEGRLNEALLSEAIEILKGALYSLGPERQVDGKRREQILHALEKLKGDGDLKKILMRVSKPHQHKYADQIIRNTLDMPPFAAIGDAHARRAVLAAWMGFLRQNVGSCFATAPAIMIHNEQPHQFLSDVSDILATGRLKRVFGGNEYSVPLSPSWGKGDLKKPVLMQRGKEGLTPPVWKSPGLIKALETVGIKLDEGTLLESDQPLFFTDAEEIIKKILLRQLKISPQDLKEEENRPRPLSLMVHAEGSNRYKVFYDKFELACNAFKAFSENALLKAWEFTIASFAETKHEFTRWNLYSSLGLKPEEKGGIGYCIYTLLRSRLEYYNAKVRDLQSEYEQLFTHLKHLEGRMRRAVTEEEVKWLKVEYQTRSNQFYSVEEMRDSVHQKAQKIGNLYNVLIDHYFKLFPNYFQEVYDADMQEVQAGPFDDSPAGFRLLYKHGRTNTSQWTMIRSSDEYVEALVAFFTSTETEIASLPEMEDLQEELTQLVTDIVSHVRTKEFLESSFYRMALAHNTRPIANPLENLDKIAKKPWVYTSGGAMAPLVSTYFRREEKPADVSRWVENPMELLVFLVDTIKQIPPRISQLVFKGKVDSFLMHSPTHAFLLKPKYSSFLQAYQSEEFTYTWLRDNGVEPMRRFAHQIYLDEEMEEYLLDRLKKRLPEHFSHHFSRRRMINLYGKMAPKEFRNILLDHFKEDLEVKKTGRCAFIG